MNYQLPFDETTKQKTNRINVGFAVLFFAMILGVGFINTASSKVMWCYFPYIFMYLPMAFFVAGAIAYVKADLSMPEATYKKSILRMRNSVYGILIFAVINIITDGIYMLIHRGQYAMGNDICFLLGQLVIIGCALAFSMVYDKYYATIRAEEKS